MLHLIYLLNLRMILIIIANMEVAMSLDNNHNFLVKLF